MVSTVRSHFRADMRLLKRAGLVRKRASPRIPLAVRRLRGPGLSEPVYVYSRWGDD